MRLQQEVRPCLAVRQAILHQVFQLLQFIMQKPEIQQRVVFLQQERRLQLQLMPFHLYLLCLLMAQFVDQELL